MIVKQKIVSFDITQASMKNQSLWIEAMLLDGWILTNQVKADPILHLIFTKPNLEDVSSSSWFSSLRDVANILLTTITRGKIRL